MVSTAIHVAVALGGNQALGIKVEKLSRRLSIGCAPMLPALNQQQKHQGHGFRCLWHSLGSLLLWGCRESLRLGNRKRRTYRATFSVNSNHWWWIGSRQEGAA